MRKIIDENYEEKKAKEEMENIVKKSSAINQIRRDLKKKLNNFKNITEDKKREIINLAEAKFRENIEKKEEKKEKIRKKIGDNMNSACTGCGYCDNCPQNIPVPSYMQLYNEKQIFGSSEKEMKKKSYLWGITESHGARANECTECGQCEELCTQHLPIIERLKEIASWEKK